MTLVGIGGRSPDRRSRTFGVERLSRRLGNFGGFDLPTAPLGHMLAIHNRLLAVYGGRRINESTVLLSDDVGVGAHGGLTLPASATAQSAVVDPQVLTKYVCDGSTMFRFFALSNERSTRDVTFRMVVRRLSSGRVTRRVVTVAAGDLVSRHIRVRDARHAADVTIRANGQELFHRVVRASRCA